MGVLQQRFIFEPLPYVCVRVCVYASVCVLGVSLSEQMYTCAGVYICAYV